MSEGITVSVLEERKLVYILPGRYMYVSSSVSMLWTGE